MTNERAPERARTAADEAARLLRRAASLAAKGQVAEAAAIQQRIADLLAAAAPATSTPAQSPETTVSVDRGQAVRGVVIDALNDLGVPSSPREIAAYGQARFGVRLEPRLFASLRRDEQRTWKSTRSQRPVYIVPALTAAAPSRLLAMRGKLALSDWPLERRLVGPLSERVDHLSATVNLTRQLAWLRAAKPAEAERVGTLVARYATNVADALDHPSAPDPVRIEKAVLAELDVLGQPDSAWRAEAAATARELLTPDEQLWGVAPPQALEATG